jgi:hypothetical protein
MVSTRLARGATVIMYTILVALPVFLLLDFFPRHLKSTGMKNIIDRKLSIN